MALSMPKPVLPARVPALVRYVCALGGLVAFGAITFFGLNSPVLPYTKLSEYTVDRVLDGARAGDIKPGDEIFKFNGQPYYPCMYLWNTPIYDAPRNVPISVGYYRNGAYATTSIELTSPGASDLLSRAPVYAVSFLFIVVAGLILTASPPMFSNFLVGSSGLWAGLLLAAGPNISDFNAPLSVFYWLGIPVWAVIQVAAQAVWPVNLWGRLHVRGLVLLQGILSLAYAAVTVAAMPKFGCYNTDFLFALGGWLYLICFGLPCLVTLYLLLMAYRLSADPFSRLRIRALALAIAIGMGIPLLFSVVPSFFNLPWVMPPELALLFAGIIPLTYLFAIYKGELLSVNRYLNRTIFMGAFFTVWIVVSWTLTAAILYWFPHPNVELVAVIVTIPPLLLATSVRDRLGLFVDLALNGVHYKIEAVVAYMGKTLTGVLDENSLADVIVKQLPAVLLIKHAALWLPVGDGDWRLVAHSHQPRDEVAGLPAAERDFFSQSQTVEVLESPHYIGSDPTPWGLILRFRVNGGNSLGVALFGSRLRESVYSSKDVHTLTTLADWITTTIVNLNVLAERRAAAERERRLMLQLAETEEDTRLALAAELHDQGISALSLVRLMVTQRREPAVIVAAVERVIKDLRGMTDRRLSPMALDQGLAQAIEAMVDKQRYLGIPVSFTVAENYAEPPALSSLARRELYYIAQEAVTNAAKHAGASRIMVSLARADDAVQLVVADDGKGFDARGLMAGRATRGLGIMQARAARIGGQFHIESGVAGGTIVEANWRPAG